MKRCILQLLFAVFVPTLALAVPTQIPYTGLLSENGTPVSGVVNLTVKLYPTPAGGSELYSESFPGTAVQNGVYHLMLNVPPNVWDGTDRWLAVSVNGGSPLEPRVQISSVPYAVRAGLADSAMSITLISEDWQLPILENGWENYGSGYAPARFFKDATGIVHVQGLIRNRLLGFAAFTLPPGYRPGARLIFATITDPNTVARVDVADDGSVIPITGNSPWLSVSGISFRADP